MHKLTSDQINRYEQDGYIAPIDIMSKDEADEIRKEIELIEKKWPNEIEGLGRNYVHLISPVFDKISSLRQRLQDRGIDIPIQVDGGINLKTIARASLAGTTHFVAGSAVFTVKAGEALDEKDRLETYRKNINGLIEEATKDQFV